MTQYHEREMRQLLIQNIHQLQSTLTQRVKAVNEAHSTHAFTAASTQETFQYSLGLWLDVKDTAGQWLEAQVVNTATKKVLVHYNGWGARWDEWLDTNSLRIAPFRTHTLQSPSTPFSSPYPHLDAQLEQLHGYSPSLGVDDLLEPLRKAHLVTAQSTSTTKSLACFDNTSGSPGNRGSLNIRDLVRWRTQRPEKPKARLRLLQLLESLLSPSRCYLPSWRHSSIVWDGCSRTWPPISITWPMMITV